MLTHLCSIPFAVQALSTETLQKMKSVTVSYVSHRKGLPEGLMVRDTLNIGSIQATTRCVSQPECLPCFAPVSLYGKPVSHSPSLNDARAQRPSSCTGLTF